MRVILLLFGFVIFIVFDKLVMSEILKKGGRDEWNKNRIRI